MPEAPPLPPLPEPLAARKRALDYHLASLGAHDRGRIFRGVAQLVVGTTLVTVGSVLDRPLARSLLWVVGAEALAHGTLELTVAPHAREVARRYAAQPVLTAEDAERQVRLGTEALDRLAIESRRMRIADGSVTMASSLSYVPLWWGLSRRDDASYRFGSTGYDYVALTLSVINFAYGMFNALMPSEAEKRARSYRALDARLGGAGLSVARQ